MQKTLFSKGSRVFLRLLREARARAGITQEQLAQRLGVAQSFISKCERREQQLDVLELHAWCNALGTNATSFVNKLEKALPQSQAHVFKRGD